MLIFVSLFVGFYLMQISYAFMTVGITTMLALLYGLLGQFSIGVLLTRIEETAVGAAIGILAAMVALPTSTRGAVSEKLPAFLAGLAWYGADDLRC